MSKSRSFAALAIGGAALVMAAGSAEAAIYPTVGADTGPGIIITLNPGGSGTLTVTGQGPYDGVEDTYIGLENNSGATVNSIVISGPNISGGTSIFGFDGDGIGAPVAGVYTGTGTHQYGTPNASDATGPCIGTFCTGGGYGGPRGYFSGLIDGSPNDSGTFNIVGGLADGDFTWFSLEGPLTDASFTVRVGATTPLPAALPLFASGLGVLGVVASRRKKRKKTASAT